MALFRKKPVVVEASQWFKPGDHSAVMCRTFGSETELPWVRSKVRCKFTLATGSSQSQMGPVTTHVIRICSQQPTNRANVRGCWALDLLIGKQ